MRILAAAAAFLFLPTRPIHHSTPDKACLDSISAALLSGSATAQMAHRNAGNQAVRAYGDSVLFADIIVQQQLERLARAGGLTLSDTIAQVQAGIDQALVNLAGASFDSAFLKSQIAIQKKMILLLQQELQTGADSLVRAFAGDRLPLVRRQLSKATELTELYLLVMPAGSTSARRR